MNRTFVLPIVAGLAASGGIYIHNVHVHTSDRFVLMLTKDLSRIHAQLDSRRDDVTKQKHSLLSMQSAFLETLTAIDRLFLALPESTDRNLLGLTRKHVLARFSAFNTYLEYIRILEEAPSRRQETMKVLDTAHSHIGELSKSPNTIALRAQSRIMTDRLKGAKDLLHQGIHLLNQTNALARDQLSTLKREREQIAPWLLEIPSSESPQGGLSQVLQASIRGNQLCDAILAGISSSIRKEIGLHSIILQDIEMLSGFIAFQNQLN